MTHTGVDRASAGAAAEGVESRLLDAASELFAERGYAAVGIREIAKHAGVTVGALYHYAASKEQLLVSLLHRSYARLMPVIRMAATSESAPSLRVRGLAQAHIQVEVDQRDLWRVSRTELNLLTPESRAKVVAMRDEFEAVWDAIIEDGIAIGEFAVGDPRVARMCVVEICNGVGTWFRLDGRLTLDQIVEEIANNALRVLGARGHASPR